MFMQGVIMRAKSGFLLKFNASCQSHTKGGATAASALSAVDTWGTDTFFY
jgi:hypothetical protein